MFELKYNTPIEWTDKVLADFGTFLQDHAAAEKKASGMAMSMLSHYPDRIKLVKAMTDLASEEMIHFKQVLKLLNERDMILGNDQKDQYIIQIRKLVRNGKDEFLIDRLLVAAVIEARGHERFSLVAEVLEPGKDKDFYVSIAKSEEAEKPTTKITFSFAREELKALSPRGYTLQLGAMTSLEDVQSFIEEYNVESEARIYPTVRNDVEWFIITYRDYPTIQVARDAVESLPESLRSLGPWAKSLNQVHREIDRAK